jgi:hypothetical protein
METRFTVRRGLKTKIYFIPSGCSHGLLKGRSGIGLWMRASSRASPDSQSRASRDIQADEGHDDDGGDDNQEVIDDQIVQDIEAWKGEAKERRLTLLKKALAIEADSWL